MDFEMFPKSGSFHSPSGYYKMPYNNSYIRVINILVLTMQNNKNPSPVIPSQLEDLYSSQFQILYTTITNILYFENGVLGMIGTDFKSLNIIVHLNFIIQ